MRGDFGRIELRRGANLQDNCVVHSRGDVDCVMEEDSHIGHGAVIHACRIGRDSLVGMNAVVMDNAIVGAGCIVGALTFVPAGMEIAERKVVVGNPARVVKDVSDEMLAWKTEGTALYQALPAALRRSLRPCEPLREPEPDRPAQMTGYRTWREARG